MLELWLSIIVWIKKWQVIWQRCMYFFLISNNTRGRHWAYVNYEDTHIHLQTYTGLNRELSRSKFGEIQLLLFLLHMAHNSLKLTEINIQPKTKNFSFTTLLFIYWTCYKMSMILLNIICIKMSTIHNFTILSFTIYIYLITQRYFIQ